MRYKFSWWLAGCVAILSCGEDDTPPASEIPASQQSNTMDSIAMQISKAKDLQEKKDYAAAMRIADAMIARFPGQLDALSLKAQILKAQSKPAEALAVLENAYALQPRDKELSYDLAYEYADAKNAKALSLTDTLIKYDKTETVARAWYVKATYYNNLGNEKEALRFLDSANVADYNFLDAYLDKGQLLLKQKKYEAALKAFAQGQKVAPATADFYYWVGKTQEAMGDKQNAKSNYERAYALDKEMSDAKEAAERL